ncbi:MAG: patatin-like phospholipase family protein [Paludibacteraceae bacterium]|nr:patatin-like phospholipase family protein [Paludibacteraceae bacterium]
MAKHFKFILILFFLQLFMPSMYAQKVGLVLSGGGAKGCTHVGVIRALEESGIPIDYVAGTSMGAIVASLYAMGYTPDEMEALLVSEDFLTWQKGQIEEERRFFFKSEDETPEFASFKLGIDDSLSIKPIIPTSIISPNQMNQACMYLFAQASTACDNDFDKLFVPFRCIASDVVTKAQYVHKSGDLGDAVRTSMSFPFVFKPISVNDHLMLDGGIYNNFPIDIMKEDLKADYIIGSSVSANPSTATGEDPFVLLENLIMQKTNYDLSEENGKHIEFHYTDVGLLDFYRAKELIQYGYDSTMAHIEEIKAKVKRTISQEEVNAKRLEFNKKKPPLIFKNIIINGISPQQKTYIEKNFHNDDETFDFESFQHTYFKLLSDNKISEIIAHAKFNPESGYYDLILDVTLNDHFKIGIGGNISSTSSNQLYASFRYVGMRYLSYDISLDGQIGVLYKDAHLQARIDFPSQVPFCVKIIGDINHFSYSSKQYAFYETDIPTEAYSTEFYTKAKISIPFFLKGEFNAGMGYGKIKDRYHGPYTTKEEEFDDTRYSLGTAIVQYNHNSLSHKQFPVEGTKAKITAQYVFGKRESNTQTVVDTSLTIVNDEFSNNWIQLSGIIDHYFPISKHFTIGLLGQAAFSTHKLEGNYMETLLMSPSFTPTKHSVMVFNPAFHSTTYFAAGFKPIYKFNKFLHLRFENYAYVPYKAIIPTALFSAEYDSPFSKFYAISELTAVAQLKYITASIYGNWYSYPKRNWNVGLNIGFLIFHDKLIE